MQTINYAEVSLRLRWDWTLRKAEKRKIGIVVLYHKTHKFTAWTWQSLPAWYHCINSHLSRYLRQRLAIAILGAGLVNLRRAFLVFMAMKQVLGLVNERGLARIVTVAAVFFLVNVALTTALHRCQLLTVMQCMAETYAGVEVFVSFSRDNVGLWDDVLGASSAVDRSNPRRLDYVASSTTTTGIFALSSKALNSLADNSSISIIYTGVFGKVASASTACEVRGLWARHVNCQDSKLEIIACVEM